MKKVKIVLSGASGYGACYLKLLREYVDASRFTLCAIVDPFVTEIESDWVKAQKIPLYRSLEEFYAADTADLAIISCPIRFHKEQCIYAMKNGSHVLCEKPLTVEMQDAEDLKEAAAQYGKYLGVGFQWSFCTPVLSLKRDILSGRFGRPKMLKTLVCWKRYDDYYQNSTWKGRIYDQSGLLVQDSVATNAGAHYLHNLFFVMGDSLYEAAMPESVSYAVYRGKEIESFDTCFARGEFAGGAKFFYVATHSDDIDIDPLFRYEFENAVITMEKPVGNPHIIARFSDGTEIDYGAPQCESSDSEKITTMIDLIQNGGELPCSVDTILPHLAVCTGFFREAPIYSLPEKRIYREENPGGTFMHGLTDDCRTCYEKELLPSEAGMDWAAAEKEFRPGKYMEMFLDVK